MQIGQGSNVKCRHIDQVGIFVCYDTENQLNLEIIRYHLPAKTRGFRLVEADNPKEALEKFFNEQEGAKIGGEGEENKALWINREIPIQELPSCKLLHKNKKGEFICGEPTEDGSGEIGMCILEGDDPPSFCPLSPFFDRLSKLELSELERGEGKIPTETIQGGYRLVRPKDIMTTSLA
ncbi:MAG: hypothetical protein PHS07_01130 [Patescibacteria group bacterium]|nr:hypothetical protein [Patescibacteria group bacterium]